jgi:two-component system nitrogen regulation response regulator GlnG
VKLDRDPFDSLISRLNEARALVFDLQRLSRHPQDLPPAGTEEVEGLGSDLLHFVASADLPVLLSGAAGAPAASTARMIHEHSPWGAANFLELRAASLKGGDIQSHLEDGRRRNGSGHLGTMYVDEITNLDPDVQEELIAYLEPNPGRSYGSSLPVRLISSTSRSIEGALDTGALSERLYALAARIILPIPPAKSHRSRPTMHRSFTTWIVAEVKRLRGSRDGQLYSHFLGLLQGSLIRVVLERTGGNQIRAARLLGVNRNTLRKWMRLLGGAPDLAPSGE